MSHDITPARFVSPFDKIRRIDDEGEYWMDEKLGETFGYSEYSKFTPVVNKAKVACEKSGNLVENHFAHVSVIVKLGSGSKREVTRTRLSRYAAYLCALEADASKKIVAEAKTYFAIRTREAEVAEALENEMDADLRQILQLTQAIQQTRNEQKRLAAVQEEQNAVLANHTARLASIEHNTGWQAALAYAIENEFPYTDTATMSRFGKLTAKITREMNLEPRKTVDQRYGKVGLYPIEALEAAKTKFLT